METRRSVLRATVVAATVGLAGCLGDDDSEDERADGPDERDDERGDERPDATESLAAVRAELGELIEDVHTVVTDPEVTLDDRQLRQQVESIEPKIEDVRDEIGSQEQADQQRALRRLRRLLDDLIEIIERIRDGSEDFQAALDGLDTEPFGEIETQLADAAGEIRGANRGFDRIRDQFAEVRPEVATFEKIDIDRLETTIDEAEAISEMVIGVNEGIQTWVRGYETALIGLTDYDEGRYEDAERELTRASSTFSRAVDKLETTKANTDPERWEGFEIYLCLADSFEDATTHYRDAAIARRDGDEETALVHEETAEAALDRCE